MSQLQKLVDNNLLSEMMSVRDQEEAADISLSHDSVNESELCPPYLILHQRRPRRLELEQNSAINTANIVEANTDPRSSSAFSSSLTFLAVSLWVLAPGRGCSGQDPSGSTRGRMNMKQEGYGVYELSRIQYG